MIYCECDQRTENDPVISQPCCDVTDQAGQHPSGGHCGWKP